MATGEERLGAAMSAVGGRKRSRYSSRMRKKNQQQQWRSEIKQSFGATVAQTRRPVRHGGSMLKGFLQ